jgi:hypothetical protein
MLKQHDTLQSDEITSSLVIPSILGTYKEVNSVQVEGTKQALVNKILQTIFEFHHVFWWLCIYVMFYEILNVSVRCVDFDLIWKFSDLIWFDLDKSKIYIIWFDLIWGIIKYTWFDLIWRNSHFIWFDLILRLLDFAQHCCPLSHLIKKPCNLKMNNICCTTEQSRQQHNKSTATPITW